MQAQTAIQTARWIRGTVVHWSVYCLVPETDSAVLQYYFLEAGDDDRLTPRIFLLTAAIDPNGPDRDSLMRSYGSIVASSLVESGAVAAAAAASVASIAAAESSVDDYDYHDDYVDDDEGGKDDDVADAVAGGDGDPVDRREGVRESETESGLDLLERRLARRSTALARLLLYGHGPKTRLLRRLFTPIEILVGTRPGDLEILAVRPWEDAAPGLLQAVATFPVYRIRVPGSYRSDVPARTTQPASEARGDPSSEVWRTRAHQRLCRGRSAGPLTIVIRAGSRRIVFDDGCGVGGVSATGEPQVRPISELFDIQDVVWMNRRLRLCTPKGFLALAFNDDQCPLLLRDAFARLFDEAYAGFSGIYPMFDFLAPNMFRHGGPRSVFLPGFPCVPVYSVPWPHNAAAECGADAIRHQMALVGLPDVVGAVGKASVLDFPGGSVEFVSGPAVSDLEHHYTDLRTFRVNARWCFPWDVSGHAVGDFDCSDAHIYANRRGVCKVSLRGLRLAVVRRCLPGDGGAFPFVLDDSGRRTDLAAVTAFLERLRDGSPRVFRRVRALENHFSRVITDACDREGFAWILVRNDCEFYVRRPRGDLYRPERLESVVRTALGKAWSASFGPQFGCPVEPEIAVSRAGVLLAVDRFVLGGFEDPVDEYVPGWICSAGRFLAEAVYQAFDAADWSAKSAIVKIMATQVLKMSARRHEPSFWVERFAPGRNPMDDRSPAIDCSEFSGVRVTGGVIAVQTSEAALTDRIDYEGYVRRTFYMLRICLRRVIRVLCYERLEEERRNEEPGSFSATQEAENVVEEALREFEDAFEEAQEHVLSRYTIFFRLC